MALLWASTKENFKKCLENILQIFMKLMGLFLMTLVVILMSIALYAYFSTLLPLELNFLFGEDPSTSKKTFGTIQSIISIYLVVLIVFNYYECLSTDPGTVNKEQYLRWKRIDNYLKKKQEAEQQQENGQQNQDNINEIQPQASSSNAIINDEQENVVIDIDEKQQLLSDDFEDVNKIFNLNNQFINIIKELIEII